MLLAPFQDGSLFFQVMVDPCCKSTFFRNHSSEYSYNSSFYIHFHSGVSKKKKKFISILICIFPVSFKEMCMIISHNINWSKWCMVFVLSDYFLQEGFLNPFVHMLVPLLFVKFVKILQL